MNDQTCEAISLCPGQHTVGAPWGNVAFEFPRAKAGTVSAGVKVASSMYVPPYLHDGS